MKTRTRREAVAAMAAAAGAAPLAGQHTHDETLHQIRVAYTPRVLTKDEYAWAARLADAIIPRTDTPGASDAGVPEFIDRRMRGSARLAAEFRKGKALLDAESQRRFQARADALDEARMIGLLTPVSQAPDTDLGRFFTLLKNLAIDGYYSSRAGLVDELGWHGNTYLPEFPGCTHKEHQS